MLHISKTHDIVWKIPYHVTSVSSFVPSTGLLIACYISVGCWDRLIQQGGRLLTTEEKSQAEKIINEKRLHDFLMGRLCAKRALEAYQACLGNQQREDNTLHVGVGGEPFYMNPTISLSLAHSANHVVAVVTQPHVVLGIDVESIDGFKEIDPDFISSAEWALQPEGEKRDIYKGLIWCAKEALSKYLKTGFRAHYDVFAIKNVMLFQNIYKIEYSFFPHLCAWVGVASSFIYALTLEKRVVLGSPVCCS